MRIRTAAAGLVLAVGMLTGCEGGDGRTGNGVNQPLARETADPREEFLSALEGAEFESWTVDAPPEGEIAGFPPKWCRAAAAGHSVGWMLEGDGSDDLYPLGWDWGTKLADAEQAVVMGIMAYCPDHRDAAVESLRDGTVAY